MYKHFFKRLIDILVSLIALPFLLPVSRIVRIFFALAAMNILRIFSALPPVEIPMTASPALPRAHNCWANARKGSTSLPKALVNAG